MRILNLRADWNLTGTRFVSQKRLVERIHRSVSAGMGRQDADSGNVREILLELVLIVFGVTGLLFVGRLEKEKPNNLTSGVRADTMSSATQRRSFL